MSYSPDNPGFEVTSQWLMRELSRISIEMDLVSMATGGVGSTGPIGPIGATGPTGPEGPAGAIGLEGPAGPIGHDGLQGVPGHVGPKGDRGTGLNFCLLYTSPSPRDS